MPRKYSHIQEHEKEILELRRQGMTLRQIGEKLGFTHKEMRGFLTRYNRKQRKLAAGNLQQESLQGPRDDRKRRRLIRQVLITTKQKMSA